MERNGKIAAISKHKSIEQKTDRLYERFKNEYEVDECDCQYCVAVWIL